ncbi:hypothetical protein [Lichenicola sp.]|uniref:hypothetical protein n=1 Tax=Lichenicola sp. TaxID=2804529 RepID=UPI003AFFB78E
MTNFVSRALKKSWRMNEMAFTVGLEKQIDWLSKRLLSPQNLFHYSSYQNLSQFSTPVICNGASGSTSVNLLAPKLKLNNPINFVRLFGRDFRNVDLQFRNWLKPSHWTQINQEYTYFFVGEPDQIRLDAQALRVKGLHGLCRIEVKAQDLVSHLQIHNKKRIFFRSGDGVLIILGGYQGPATVTPI